MTTGSSLGVRMAAEMAEQPDRLGSLLDRADEVAAMVHDLSPRPLAATVLIARGSSDHAATTGRYLLEMATGRPVSSAAPSVQTHYRSRVDYSGCLVVAVSQSGRTPEIVTSAERARAAGGRVVAITNEDDSPLAGVADAVLALGVGEEEAVPATKTVTAQLAAFALLAQAFDDVGFDLPARTALPSAVAALIADPGPADELAGWLASTDRLVTVARGLLSGAGAETALKIEETTSLFATAYSAADLRHGPIAIATDGLPVLALAHPGPVADDVLSLVDDLRRRGADVRVAGPVAGTSLPWPAEVPEVSATVLAVVRAQQVALALARRLGRDPDSPQGLTKVTRT
jgi:glucosamine--fructose-6-phosphate aminotransferase (isomerizing)